MYTHFGNTTHKCDGCRELRLGSSTAEPRLLIAEMNELERNLWLRNKYPDYCCSNLLHLLLRMCTP